MNLGYNISFSIAAVVIDIVLFLIVSINYSKTNMVNKRFRYFLIASLVMFALDIGTVITNAIAAKLPDAFNYLFNSLYFLSGVIVSVLFFYYCCSFALKDETAKTRKAFYIANLAGVGLLAVILIVNCFTGFYFHFDYSKEFPYTHGDFFLLINIFTLVFVFESLVIFIVKRRQFNFRQIICTAMFFAAFLISYALQVFVFPNTLLSDFGTAVGALIIFFSIETPDYAKLMFTLNELHELKASLEIQVAARTEELKNEKASYEELTLETLSSLANVIDAKDHYTNGHSFRVAAYAKGMAKELGFSPADAEQIYFSGLIHDVGKIGISESILTKPGKLSPDEFALIQSHSSIGGDILRGIKEFPVFQQVARSHHERYDGKGYPDKLVGEDIPFYARIVTICDCFDAMTSDRAYRKALSDQTAIDELIKYKGTQFDPELVEVFLKLYRSFPDSIRNHIDELAKE